MKRGTLSLKPATFWRKRGGFSAKRGGFSGKFMMAMNGLRGKFDEWGGNDLSIRNSTFASSAC